MFEIIGVSFVFVITGIIVYAVHYECEHTDEYHGYDKKKLAKMPHKYETLWGK